MRVRSVYHSRDDGLCTGNHVPITTTTATYARAVHDRASAAVVDDDDDDTSSGYKIWKPARNIDRVPRLYIIITVVVVLSSPQDRCMYLYNIVIMIILYYVDA